MMRLLFIFGFSLAFLCNGLAHTDSALAQEEAAPAAPPATEGSWLEVDIGIIGASSADILESTMKLVREQGHAGLIIRLDTPGGALENTRAMVKAIMDAEFPIIVWVGPAGSRAGSAGAFITLAGHIAAMAPGTNIGAAHPVGATGENIGEEMERKVTNDTVAFIESVAKARGRNVEMARSFVATSVSVTAEEALENDVIDLIAKNVDELMGAVDGRTIELRPGTSVTLATKDAPRETYELTFRQKLLEILSNPNLFYLLFMAGIIGLGYELTHPGMLFPGVVGGICLVLALIATSVLPISYGAAALILLGVALLIAEAFVTSFGILGIGGLVAFVLGSIFLVDPNNESGLRISWYAIAPGALTVGAAFLALGYLIVRSERAPVQSGSEAMLGATGVAITDFKDGRGQVRVEGAIWRAHAPTDVEIREDDTVVVKKMQGLELEVAKHS